MKLFQNESETMVLGPNATMTVENRTDRISVYGQMDITRDAEGLSTARVLLAFLEEVVGELSAERRNGTLPDQIEIKSEEEVQNPFK